MTTYFYDALGRTKEKTIGKSTTIFHNDSYNLYETIDAAGLSPSTDMTSWAEKLKRERRNRISRFGYDALGFLAWEERRASN